MESEQSSPGTGTVTEERVKVKRPRKYKVILLNDDYTTMDFVVMILETIFGKSPAEAVQIMLNVHHKGKGLCGVYSKEIAEAKIEAVHRKAREEGFPLRCTMEPE
ncbi:MAG: ATP-dependent Clp protease adapter ClpS [Candidatus Dadabacteria bacterium]|nr:MAG: ATP-dependent Clp protease adapter ClpS [Candidatus Dadabacteria bacterium]